MKKILSTPFIIKLLNWEYWPFDLVYAPVYLYWFWLGLRSRAVFFFNTSNPGIKNAGFLLESKKAIYDILPAGTYPFTLFFPVSLKAELVLKEVDQQQLSFPLIAKPDIGMRGLGVQKLQTRSELLQYAAASKVDFLVQEYVPYEKELGIFYYRYPHQANGKISGIVSKEFLTVTGNGHSTIEALIQQDARCILQLATLRVTHPGMLGTILEKGQQQVLVPYGNHSRGAKFVDATNKADEQLNQTIDALCKQVPGFYFGRLDIRYNSWEELKEGRNFSIIELNGAGSEPTHIYDPKHSIFYAWKEIIRHLGILYDISKHNHTKANIPYMKFTDGLRMLRENNAYVKLIS